MKSKDDFSNTALTALNKNKQAAQSILVGNQDINANKDKRKERKETSNMVSRNLVMSQELFKDLTDLAKLYGVTFAQFTTTNLEQVVESKREFLEEYRKLREKVGL